MDPRRRALAVDFGLALAAVAVGGLATPADAFASPARALGVAAIVVLGLGIVLATMALVELTDALEVIDAHGPTSLVLAGGVVFVVALALILGRLVVPWPSGPLLAGMGAGLAGYRTRYGLLGPLPERRLAQAGDVWPP